MRRYVIAAIFAFCLTMTLFLAIPTKSNPTVGEYDPWADINDDGKINMYDIGYTARLFGTTGTAINKTELLLGLQAQIDSLNASLMELINQTRNIYEVEIKAHCLVGNHDLIVDVAKNGIPSGYNTTSKFILMGDNTFTVPLISPDNHTFKHWNTGNTNTTITVSSLGVYTAYYEPSAPDWFNGLVGYWKLDEGNGTIAGDSSGNNNNGTLQNGPTWVEGKFGNSLSFDGTDDYVTVPDSASLRVQSFSIAAWVYMTVRPYQAGHPDHNHVCIVNKMHYYNTTAKAGYKLDFEYPTSTDDTLVISIGDGVDQRLLVQYNSINDLTLNQWHQIVGTYNGSTAKIYIDGQLKATGNSSYTILQDSTPLCLSREISQPTYDGFNGTIDNIMIYNRSLTAEEITLHYLLPSP